MEGCRWKIHATTLKDGISWAIKSLQDEHSSCQRIEENPMANSAWLAKKLKEDIRANTDIPVALLKQLCMERYRVNVKERLFYVVKQIALEEIFGKFSASYSMTPAYGEMIKQTNPNSYALVIWKNPQRNMEPVFKGCFFAFNACLQGFLKGCRPLIGVDRAHLSGRFKGVLLSAMSVDGNNEILCIGCCIFYKESTESGLYLSGLYFFRNLRNAFKQHGVEKDDWTFICDRMRGVDKAMFEVFPKATRRVCAQHLYSNWKGSSPGKEFYDLFWMAANAYNPVMYRMALNAIQKMDPVSAQYLDSVPEQWSRHQFESAVTNDHNTTNFVESFNACTKPLRDKPVMSLLEEIRNWQMKKIGSRFDRAAVMSDSDITEYAARVVEARGDESRLCYVVKAGGTEFEVRELHVRYPVRMDTKCCACGVWQGTGIPCKHALRVIYNERKEPKDYVSDFFKGVTYKQTYSTHMHPMPDHTQWPEFNLPKLQPPPMQRTAGRPTKARKRGKDEPRKAKRSVILKCSKCSCPGHNSRTCQGGLTAKQRKGAAAATSSDKGKKPASQKRSKRKNSEGEPSQGQLRKERSKGAVVAGAVAGVVAAVLQVLFLLLH